MLEFLAANYYMAFYGITLIIALARYRWYFDSVLKYFPMILGYTLLTELLGYFIFNFEGFQLIYSDKYPFANNFIFNIYEVVFFLFFYNVFWKSVNNAAYKRVIKYGAIAYIIASLINPFIQNILIFPQLYASTVGSIIIIIAILLYFNESSKKSKKSNTLLIWTSIGLLIFNLIYPIVMLVGRYNYELYEELNLRHLHHFLIVAMYSCFIIGFLRMRGRFSP